MLLDASNRSSWLVGGSDAVSAGLHRPGGAGRREDLIKRLIKLSGHDERYVERTCSIVMWLCARQEPWFAIK